VASPFFPAQQLEKTLRQRLVNIYFLVAGRMSRDDRFLEWRSQIKDRLQQCVLSSLYNVGLGYESMNPHGKQDTGDLFQELVIEAQDQQRADPSQIFHFIAKGNLYEVQQELHRIESGILGNVKDELTGQWSAGVSEEVYEPGPNASAVYDTDCAGANIVHCAYLLKNYHVGRYLVQRYPRLASFPYSGSVVSLTRYIEGANDAGGGHATEASVSLRSKLDALRKRLSISNDSELEKHMHYTGQNVLHILILHRNYEEVRWLLDFYRDRRHSHPDCCSRILNTDATGSFFDRSGSFYVGSSPLHFAVCSNSTAIFDLVYGHINAIGGERIGGATAPLGPDALFSTDKYGNNVLHLCVLHGLENMYQHICDTALQVLRRKLHKLYTGYYTHQDSTAAGFALQRDTDESEHLKGYRQHEKVLYLPSSPDTLFEWVHSEAQRKVDERLVLALNEDLHSPLTLAAYIIDKKDSPEQLALKVRRFLLPFPTFRLGVWYGVRHDMRLSVVTNVASYELTPLYVFYLSQVSMLTFLVGKARQKLWEYGPTAKSVIDLTGLEIQHDVLQRYDCVGRERDVAAQPVHSAIRWLCINDSDKVRS
jgi:hypothetical protein